jgi:Trehalose-phosphatase
MDRLAVLFFALPCVLSFGSMSYNTRFPNIFNAIDMNIPVVIFCDIDGTISDNTEHICLHPLVLPAVKKITAHGGIFVPSSGRDLRQVVEAFKELPDLYMSGNDGMEMRLAPHVTISYSDKRPNFEAFKKALDVFIRDMPDVRVNDMGYYWTLLISDKHPQRLSCEHFFKSWEGKVTADSDGLEMLSYRQPNTITMEPRNNRGKEGVIEYMLPIIVPEDAQSFVIAIGDARNDLGALELAQDLEGEAIFVQRGTFGMIPQEATSQLKNVDDCAYLLNFIADYMHRHAMSLKKDSSYLKN